jgi:hypothetical protein
MKYSKLGVTGSQFDQNWGWNQKSGWKHYKVGGKKKKEEAKPDRSFTPNFGFDSSMPSLLLLILLLNDEII